MEITASVRDGIERFMEEVELPSDSRKSFQSLVEGFLKRAAEEEKKKKPVETEIDFSGTSPTARLLHAALLGIPGAAIGSLAPMLSGYPPSGIGALTGGVLGAGAGALLSPAMTQHAFEKDPQLKEKLIRLHAELLRQGKIRA